MKVILSAVCTANGQLARTSGQIDWASKEDHSHFVQLLKRVGVMIEGWNTYEVVKNANQQLSGFLRVVITHDQSREMETTDTIITTKSPDEILMMLEAKGYKEVVLGGGGGLIASFLAADLVDEIYLTIEPVILGLGIPLVHPTNLEKRLTLVDSKMLNQSTIRLHYRVVKKN